MDQFNYCYGKFKKELKLNKMDHERFVRTDKLLKHNLPVIIAKKRGTIFTDSFVSYICGSYDFLEDSLKTLSFDNEVMVYHLIFMYIENMCKIYANENGNFDKSSYEFARKIDDNMKNGLRRVFDGYDVIEKRLSYKGDEKHLISKLFIYILAICFLNGKMTDVDTVISRFIENPLYYLDDCRVNGFLENDYDHAPLLKSADRIITITQNNNVKKAVV